MIVIVSLKIVLFLVCKFKSDETDDVTVLIISNCFDSRSIEVHCVLVMMIMKISIMDQHVFPDVFGTG